MRAHTTSLLRSSAFVLALSPQAWSVLRASCARGYATTPSLRDYDAVTIAQTKPQRGAVVVNPMRESIGDATKHGGKIANYINLASEKRCCGL